MLLKFGLYTSVQNKKKVTLAINMVLEVQFIMFKCHSRKNTMNVNVNFTKFNIEHNHSEISDG